MQSTFIVVLTLSTSVFGAKCLRKPIAPAASIIEIPAHYAPKGSSYLGCYHDMEDRVLVNQFSTTAGSETESCYNHAVAQHATYFGLQYGNQCFTGGHSTNITRYGVHVPDAQCDMNCGDPSLPKTANSIKCGSVWFNSIYEIKGFPTLPAPVVPTTADYKYQGCYIDNPVRVLSDMVTVSGTDLVKACLAHAISHHATYFSLQSGSQCFVGDSKTNLQLYGKKQSEDLCNYSCGTQTGADYIPNLKCGGFWANSVYVSKKTVQIKADPVHKEYTYKGCFIDSEIRVLPHKTIVQGNDLTYQCYKTAMANGDAFFGLQYGNECHTGPKSSILTKYGKVQDSECNYACGLPNGKDFGIGPKCGGYWRNSIYAI